MGFRLCLIAFLVIFAETTLTSCATTSSLSSYSERGIASWYGPGFQGRRTASGERFNMHELTAAHKTLPLQSVVRVRSIENGETVSVRINDRGPYTEGRLIDLSYEAARRLGLLNKGMGEVQVDVVSMPASNPTSPSQR